MMTTHSSTISLLLLHAHIMGTISTTTTLSSTEGSSPGMSSFSTMSLQVTPRPSPATTTQLRSSLNPGTKPSELIYRSTLQGNMSSSPCINMTAETVAGGSTSLKPMFNTYSFFLCSLFTLLCILRHK